MVETRSLPESAIPRIRILANNGGNRGVADISRDEAAGRPCSRSLTPL